MADRIMPYGKADLLATRLPGENREMSRTETLTTALEAMRCARECFRQLAITDRDARWLIAVRNMDFQADQVRKEMVRPKAGRQLLWLPGQPIAP